MGNDQRFSGCVCARQLQRAGRPRRLHPRGDHTSPSASPRRADGGRAQLGPVENESALEEILAAFERARADGTVLTGGERADAEGYLIAHTVVEGLADDAEDALLV